MSDLRGNGTLIIVVLKARNLPNRRKLDKQNPYCIARIANIVDRTPAITRGGQTPEWNHESRFQLTSDISPLLKLSVLDETKKLPVLIGDTEVDCSPVFSTSCDEGYDKWHPLQYAGRSAGEVYVEMTFYPTTPAEPVRKKGAVTLHRNTVRPLPNRPGEEDDSFADYDQDGEAEDNIYNRSAASAADDVDDVYLFKTGSDSFRSYRPSVYTSQHNQNNPYRSSRSTYSDNASSALSDLTDAPWSRSRFSCHDHQQAGLSEARQPLALAPMLDDSIARQILREYPDKFEELLARNPEIVSSILKDSVPACSPGHSVMTSRSDPYSQNQRHQHSRYQGTAFHRKSHSTSPIRHAPSQFQRNIKSINASFDDLEKEVQTDWYRNNLGTSRYSQYMPRSPSPPPQKHHLTRSQSPQRRPRNDYDESIIESMKISAALPKLPDFEGPQMFARNYARENHARDYHRDSDNVPPPPPHKSINSTSTGTRVSRRSSPVRYVRKPPPLVVGESLYSKQSFAPFPHREEREENGDDDADEALLAKFTRMNLGSMVSSSSSPSLSSGLYGGRLH